MLYLVNTTLKVIFLSIDDQANFMAKRLFPSEIDAPYRRNDRRTDKNTDPDVYKRSLYENQDIESRQIS